MRRIEIRLESERGNWEINTKGPPLGQGANASVYRADIVTTNPSSSLISDLGKMGLHNDLVLRLLIAPDPQEEDKAVNQFDHFAAAWEKLGASIRDHFMEPVFCESRGRPPNVRITGSAATPPLSRQMKKGDAIFSWKEGKTVWKLSDEGNLPQFTTRWRTQLLDLIEQVCSNEVHYRDWHSENVLLNKLSDGSYEINIIDPGALIEIERVIWETAPQRHRFDKYEIGVSIMGIQDLIWIAVNQAPNDFYDEMKEILTHPSRQLLMPKIIDK